MTPSELLPLSRGLPEMDILPPCPEWNQITMKRVQADCTLKDGTFIPKLDYFYCSSCHSKFYDDAAMERIERIRQKSTEEIVHISPPLKSTLITVMND